MSEIIKDAVLNEEELANADGGLGYPVHTPKTICPTAVYGTPGNPATIITNLPAGNPVQVIGGSYVTGYVYCKTLYPNAGFTGYIVAAHIR